MRKNKRSQKKKKKKVTEVVSDLTEFGGFDRELKDYVSSQVLHKWDSQLTVHIYSKPDQTQAGAYLKIGGMLYDSDLIKK